MRRRKRKPNPLEWIFEPLAEEPAFFRRPMFGCEAAYLGERIVLVLAAKEEPWNGILVPTERAHHASIARDIGALAPHGVLGKWLYVSQSEDAFEATAAAVVERIRRRDPRFGVVPRPKIASRDSTRSGGH